MGAGWGHGPAWAGLPPGPSGPAAWPAVCFLLCEVGCLGPTELPEGLGLLLLPRARGGCERGRTFSDPQRSLGPSLQPVRVTEKDRTLMGRQGETVVTGGLGGHISRTVSEGWPGRPGMGRDEGAVTARWDKTTKHEEAERVYMGTRLHFPPFSTGALPSCSFLVSICERWKHCMNREAWRSGLL